MDTTAPDTVGQTESESEVEVGGINSYSLSMGMQMFGD